MRVEEVFIRLNDSKITLASLLKSPYVSAIRTAVAEWHSKLTMVKVILHEWLVLQRGWVHLEEIFTNLHFRRQFRKQDKV